MDVAAHLHLHQRLPRDVLKRGVGAHGHQIRCEKREKTTTAHGEERKEK
jgi:hypothetical protein